jgi:hypothetical protein
MAKEENASTERTWHDLVAIDREFVRTVGRFLQSDRSERLEVLRRDFGKHTATVLRVLEFLLDEEKCKLLPTLMYMARSVHGHLDAVRKQILALPRKYVLANIEAATEPLLQDGNDEDHRRFIELYLDIDKKLASRLIQRALDSNNREIRGVGEDFKDHLVS